MKRLWIILMALALMSTGINVIGCSDASMKGVELEECVGEGCEPTPEPIFDPVVIIEEESKDLVVETEMALINCYDFRTPKKVILSYDDIRLQDKVAYNKDYFNPGKRKDDEVTFEDKVAYNTEYSQPGNIDVHVPKVELIDRSKITIDDSQVYEDSIEDQIKDFMNSGVDIYSDDTEVPYDGEPFEVEPLDEDPDVIDVNLCITKDELSAAKDDLEIFEYDGIKEGVLYLDPELNSKRSRLINIISHKDSKCEDIERMKCIIVDKPKDIRKYQPPHISKDRADLDFDLPENADAIDVDAYVDNEKNFHMNRHEYEVPSKFEAMMIEIDKGDPPPVDEF